MTDDVFLPGGQWRLWTEFALRGPGFPASGVLRLAPSGLAEAADKFDDDSPLTGPEWTAFEDLLSEAMVNNVRELQRIAATPAFRAAVAWQNPAVLDRAIGLFLAWDPSVDGRTSKRREREELVAHYWQRFCVKNDTIGFFGPVGWGRWDESVSGVHVDPGTGLVAGSTVYFSSWAVDAVARVIGADPRMRAWIAPRRVPFVRVDGHVGGHVGGGEARMPGVPPRWLEPLERELLVRCDGTRLPGQLAADVSDNLGEEVTEDAVVGVLDGLVRRRLLVWRLEVPTCAHPERHLRDLLDRVADPAARRDALTKVAVLERGAERIRAAGTDADALSAAFTALETEFEELTQVAAQRTKGTRTAPCRALIYSDCRRSATVRLGTDVRDALTPLTLCLTAARWMTARFAEAVGARVRQVYERLRGRGGTVDLASLWMECLPAPHGESIADLDLIQAELRARWARVLAVPDGARRVQRSTEDIADRVREEFGEPGPTWPQARYVSPDVFVVAEDAAEVARGNFELVLGELHIAMNTTSTSLWVMQHPDADRLLAETATDFPGPRLLPMLPKEQPPRWSARSRIALDRPEDYYVALVDHTVDPRRERTVLSADVQVLERGDDLVAVLPDGAEFDLLDVFSNAMTNRVMDRFSLRADADHSPRVSVDRLVVARESWSVPVADAVFAEEKTEARRFVAARRWARSLGLPRYAFVVLAGEPRPFYVDFDAPVYVNVFAKAVRRLARRDADGRVVVTEMLPSPEQAWLVDDAGERYTSELRFVAVDQSGR
ncbi:lantibiotic dehydratase [Saccharothrix sp. Mg75]|uniref:lantibiotic dehydratase n=1 Tax=Saccharothrix sp. Mg75 TaxID=3445357 RepID=UPI003EF06651